MRRGRVHRGYLWLRIHEFENAARGGERLSELLERKRKRADRLEARQHEQREHREFWRLQRSAGSPA